MLFPSDAKYTTLSEMTIAKVSVLAGTFSLKYAFYLNISDGILQFFTLSTYIEDK